MVRDRIGQHRILKILIVFFVLFGHSHLQAGTKTFRCTLAGLSMAVFTFMVLWDASTMEDDRKERQAQYF